MVGAIVKGVAEMSSTFVPLIAGTPKSSRERIFNKRQEILQNQRHLRRWYQSAKTELDQLEARLEWDLTPERARQLMDTGAEHKGRIWRARWRARLSHLKGGEALARVIGEEAQAIYLDEAWWALAKDAAPKAAAGSAALLGVSGLAYSAYQEHTHDE